MRLSSPIYKLKRQAKLNARSNGLKLNQALHQNAISEGFQDWGHLASQYSKTTPGKEIMSRIQAGDMLLIAARPGHGKTLLALELAALSNTPERTCYVFSLDYNQRNIRNAFVCLGREINERARSLVIDTSDEICAEYIIKLLSSSSEKAVVIIDYMQLLDQKREHPPLNEQLQMLKRFAHKTGTVFIFSSQVDRTFELSSNKFPTLEDIRLPNPIDTSCFNGLVFLNEGDITVQLATSSSEFAS